MATHYELTPLAQLVQACGMIRRRPGGRSIGLINGCFDLLHPGHVLMIEDAADQCDRLIVAIDDDEQVHRLKGVARPFRTLVERGYLVARLRLVSAVVRIGADQTLETVLAALKPDIYMHRPGAPENELAAARRCALRVLELPRHGGWSSTQEIARCHQSMSLAP